MPTGAFNICCPRDCVSQHNGGTSGAPLKPLRVDSALRFDLNGIRNALLRVNAIPHLYCPKSVINLECRCVIVYPQHYCMCNCVCVIVCNFKTLKLLP